MQTQEESEADMAEFRAIVIQQIGDRDEPYAYAGTDDDGNIIEDPYDNGLTHKVTASSIYVSRKRQGESDYNILMQDNEVNIDVIVTDCRVIICCMEYDKGDRKWSGGLTALALNAYEKSKAKRRSGGKLILGHIRYEWLLAIGYINKPKSGIFSFEDYGIRLFYQDTDKSVYDISLKFPKGTDTAFVANEILHAATKYRYDMQDEKDDKGTMFYTKYMRNNIEPNENIKEYSMVQFPDIYFAPRGKDYRPALAQNVDRN